MKTIHMSTTNTTDKARISCDVRWQLASEQVDNRYFGPHVGLAQPKAGLYAKDNKETDSGDHYDDFKKTVNISDLKSEWNLELDAAEGEHLNDKWGPLIL